MTGESESHAPAADGSVGAYCDHCGSGIDELDHARCRLLRELEPPRYCPLCRRRLVVQVLPRGWSARCSVHSRVS